MKKILFTLFIFLISISNVFGLELNTYSKNVLLYDLTDDTMLYSVNSDEKAPIASLTKIMTSLVAINYIDNLNDGIVITNSDLKGLVEQNASVAGFKVGEKVTYEDLLYGLLLPSGADAALSLVHNTYKSEDSFISKMNELATTIGLENTHFASVTGLDTDGNYSTVSDLVKLLKYAINNPTFYKIFTSKDYITSDLSLKFQSSLSYNADKYNLNLSYVTGSKTGTTDDAGLCLVTLAENNGTKYILATLGAPKSYKTPYNLLDAVTIYSYFFDNYEYRTIFKTGDIITTLKTKNALESKIDIKADNDIKIFMDKNIDLNNLKYVYDGENIINYNTDIGTKLGTLSILYNDKNLKNVDIVLNQKLHFNYFYILGIIVLLLIILKLRINHKRKLKKRRRLKR